MIIVKLWTTHKTGKWDEFYCDGLHYKTCERHWKGYFLFGFIPLWIVNTSTKYR